MRDFYAAGRTAASLLGAALFMAGATQWTARAQRGPRPTPVERRLEHLNRQAQQHEREGLVRGDKGAAGKPGDRKRAGAVAAQVKKDFEDLQAGYNRIVLAMASKQSPDHDAIMGSVAEVHRCAERLKGNLALPRPKGVEGAGAHVGPIPARLEESLMALRKHVYDFVTNPLFEAEAGLDVERAGKAARDLERIIELSEGIRRRGAESKKRAL